MARPRKPAKRNRAPRKSMVFEQSSAPGMAIKRTGLGTPAFNPRTLIHTYRAYVSTQSPVQVYRFVRMICEHPSFDTLPHRMKNFFRKTLPDAKSAAKIFTDWRVERLRRGKLPPE